MNTLIGFAKPPLADVVIDLVKASFPNATAPAINTSNNAILVKTLQTLGNKKGI